MQLMSVSSIRKIAVLSLCMSGISCGSSKPVPSTREGIDAPIAKETAKHDGRSLPLEQPKPRDVELLSTHLENSDWNLFERELRKDLTNVAEATEESDYKFLELSEAVQRASSTADWSDRRYHLWPSKVARIILEAYQPYSSETATTLLRQLAIQPGSAPEAIVLPDTSNRLADARMMLKTLKRIHGDIDPSFDPSDTKNWPIGNVAVPGGQGRYQPGTDPNQVEAALRDNYLLEIARNRAKNEKLKGQKSARDNEKELRQLVLEFLNSAYSKPPAAIDELQTLLEELNVETETKNAMTTRARLLIADMEQRIKINQENEKKLAELKAEGLIDDSPKK